MGWMLFAPISEPIRVRTSHLGSYLSISVDMHKSVRFCSTNSTALSGRGHSNPPSSCGEGAEKQRRVRGSVFQLQRRGLCFTLSYKLWGFALLGSGAALEEEREVYLSWRCEQHLAAIAATFI